MRTMTVSEKPGGVSSSPRSAEAPADTFAMLLAGVQAVQLETVVAGFADGSGLARRADGEQTTARSARIQQETSEARQAEVEAGTAGKADSGAIERGPLASRREGIASGTATGDEKRVAPGAVESQPGRSVTDEMTHVRPTINAGGESSLRSTPASGPRAPSFTAGTPGVNAGAPEAEPPAPQAASSPAPTAATADGAGIASTAGAVRNADMAARQATSSPAETLGRLLAGRGAVEVVKAPTEPAGAGPARDGQNAGREARMPKEQAAPPSRESDEKSPRTADAARRADFEQLVRLVRLHAGAKASSATIRLNPPALGKIRVDVRMVEDVLRVRVETSSGHTRDLLAARAAELTTALRTHDIAVERFEIVAVGQGAAHDAAADADPQMDRGLPPGGGNDQRDQGRTTGQGDAEEDVVSEGAAARDVAALVESSGPAGRLDVRI